MKTTRREESSSARHLLAAVVAGAAHLLAMPAQAQISDRIHINGYSNFEFEYQLSDHSKGKGDKNASFDADIFDIVLNVQATDRLRVAADLTWEHGPATEDGRGNVAAEYAFSEYTLHDAFRLRVGKMFVPFGIYNEIHTAKPATLIINEPLATNKPEKLGAPMRFYARWGAGLEAVGDFHPGPVHADYSVLLFNGENVDSSVNPFEEDDNGSKAVAVRARVDASSTLRLGASFYRDVRNVYDAKLEDTGDRVAQTSWGASVEWTPGGFGVELEWVGGSLPLAGTTTATANGVCLVLSHRFGEHLTPLLEAQYLDPNGSVDNDAAQVLSAGLNVRVNANMFLKLSLDQYLSDNANKSLKGVDFTQVAAAVSVGF